MTVLKTTNLTKRYGNITALDGLNLTIEAGNVYGILGPNGSGKTTTLGIILGVLRPDAGSYEWFQGNWTSSPNLKIGAILETPNFFPYLNASENLELVADIKKVSNPNIDELLEMVNLTERKNSRFNTYSLGMKQRLAIAATMIGNPEVVIFDEPTNGLDPEGITEVRNILKKVADSGRTVIMASHMLEEVEKICSHVVIIKKGKLLAVGPIGSIINNDKAVEIDADDRNALIQFITDTPWLKNHKEMNGVIECHMDSTKNKKDLSKAAFESGIILTHFVVRNTRLEEEFLEITKG